MRLDPITWPELSALLADGSEEAVGALGRTPLQVRVGKAGGECVPYCTPSALCHAAAAVALR